MKNEVLGGKRVRDGESLISFLLNYISYVDFVNWVLSLLSDNGQPLMSLYSWTHG